MGTESDIDLIQTFVFMDLETTCLYKPRICELSMIAVEKKSMLWCDVPSLPRIQHKLLLCVNPRRAIEWPSSQITGLYNDELQNCVSWDQETVQLISKFISRLPTPVCLIAHNGFNFDFPVLRSEMDRVGVRFESRIFCADTLQILKAIDAKDHEMLSSTRSPVNCESPVALCSVISRPPRAPKKCRNKNIIDFTPSLNTVNSSSSNDFTSDQAGLKNTPVKTGRGKVAAAGRSVKRNLLHDFNTRSCKKACDMLGDYTAASDSGYNCNNSDTSNSSRTISGGVSERPVIGMDIESHEMDTDDHIDNDVSGWCNDWCEAEFMSIACTVEEQALSRGSSKSPNGTDVAVFGIINGVDSQYERINGKTGQMRSFGSPTRSTIPPGSICAAEITPEKRVCEVRSPPRTPTKPANADVRNQTFARSLHAQFSVGGDNAVSVTSVDVGHHGCACTPEASSKIQSLKIAKSAQSNIKPLCKTQVILNAECSRYQGSQVAQITDGAGSDPLHRSYRLEEIYRRYFGVNPANSHSAEDDCLSLLKIAAVRSKDFCSLVDEQHVPFESLKLRI